MGELFQPMHLLIILAVACFCSVPRRSGAGQRLGEGIRGFKDAIKSATESTDTDKKVTGGEFLPVRATTL